MSSNARLAYEVFKLLRETGSLALCPFQEDNSVSIVVLLPCRLCLSYVYALRFYDLLLLFLHEYHTYISAICTHLKSGHCPNDDVRYSTFRSLLLKGGRSAYCFAYHYNSLHLSGVRCAGIVIEENSVLRHCPEPRVRASGALFKKRIQHLRGGKFCMSLLALACSGQGKGVRK